MGACSAFRSSSHLIFHDFAPASLSTHCKTPPNTTAPTLAFEIGPKSSESAPRSRFPCLLLYGTLLRGLVLKTPGRIGWIGLAHSPSSRHVVRIDQSGLSTNRQHMFLLFAFSIWSLFALAIRLLPLCNTHVIPISTRPPCLPPLFTTFTTALS